MQTCSVFSLLEHLVVVTFLSESVIVYSGFSFSIVLISLYSNFYSLSWKIQASFPGEDNPLEFTLEHLLYSLASTWRRLARNILCHKTHIN